MLVSLSIACVLVRERKGESCCILRGFQVTGIGIPYLMAGSCYDGLRLDKQAQRAGMRVRRRSGRPHTGWLEPHVCGLSRFPAFLLP